jgi:hypothetical protein
MSPEQTANHRLTWVPEGKARQACGNYSTPVNGRAAAESSRLVRTASSPAQASARLGNRAEPHGNGRKTTTARIRLKMAANDGKTAAQPGRGASVPQKRASNDWLGGRRAAALFQPP